MWVNVAATYPPDRELWNTAWASVLRKYYFKWYFRNYLGKNSIFEF